MTRHRIHILPTLSLLLLLSLAAALSLAACKGAGGPRAQEPMAGVNLSDLAKDVFVLTDQRDMAYAALKLEKEGYKTEGLTMAARHLTVDHLLAALKTMSGHVSVSRSGPTDTLIQASKLIIDGVPFSEGAFMIRHERHRVNNVEVSMARLTAVALDNKDQTVAVSWILYREALRQAAP